jgi:Transcriptional Coactivator p15 (PC4)
MRSHNRKQRSKEIQNRLNRSSRTASSATTEKHETNSLLVVVAEWPLNRQEVIRVRINKYCGRNIVDLRVWWRAGNGEYQPGTRGVSFDVCHIRQLATAFKRARVKAKRAGIIDK